MEAIIKNLNNQRKRGDMMKSLEKSISNLSEVVERKNNISLDKNLIGKSIETYENQTELLNKVNTFIKSHPYGYICLGTFSTDIKHIHSIIHDAGAHLFVVKNNYYSIDKYFSNHLQTRKLDSDNRIGYFNYHEFYRFLLQYLRAIKEEKHTSKVNSNDIEDYAFCDIILFYVENRITIEAEICIGIWSYFYNLGFKVPRFFIITQYHDLHYEILSDSLGRKKLHNYKLFLSKTNVLDCRFEISTNLNDIENLCVAINKNSKNRDILPLSMKPKVGINTTTPIHVIFVSSYSKKKDYIKLFADDCEYQFNKPILVLNNDEVEYEEKLQPHSKYLNLLIANSVSDCEGYEEHICYVYDTLLQQIGSEHRFVADRSSTTFITENERNLRAQLISNKAIHIYLYGVSSKNNDILIENTSASNIDISDVDEEEKEKENKDDKSEVESVMTTYSTMTGITDINYSKYTPRDSENSDFLSYILDFATNNTKFMEIFYFPHKNYCKASSYQHFLEKYGAFVSGCEITKKGVFMSKIGIHPRLTNLIWEWYENDKKPLFPVLLFCSIVSTYYSNSNIYANHSNFKYTPNMNETSSKRDSYINAMCINNSGFDMKDSKLEEIMCYYLQLVSMYQHINIEELEIPIWMNKKMILNISKRVLQLINACANFFNIREEDIKRGVFNVRKFLEEISVIYMKVYPNDELIYSGSECLYQSFSHQNLSYVYLINSNEVDIYARYKKILPLIVERKKNNSSVYLYLPVLSSKIVEKF